MKIEEEGVIKERYTHSFLLFLFRLILRLILVIGSHHLPHASDQE